MSLTDGRFCSSTAMLWSEMINEHHQRTSEIMQSLKISLYTLQHLSTANRSDRHMRHSSVKCM